MRRTVRDAEFATYVRADRPGLLRAASLLTAGDRHLAEDLVQDTLTRVYLAWPRLRTASVGAYARRALVNAFIDETRRPARRRERGGDDLPAVAAPVEPSVEDRERVLQALRELAPRMRAAVVLRHWLQYSVDETAAALGCSPGTVKSQTARGLERLRVLLDPAHQSTA